MSEQQVKFIAGYFEIPYLTNATKLMSSVDMDVQDEAKIFSLSEYETSNILMMRNSSDSDQIILGVTGPSGLKKGDAEMQALYSVNKKTIKIDKPWDLDFTIFDDNAICNF